MTKDNNLTMLLVEVSKLSFSLDLALETNF